MNENGDLTTHPGNPGNGEPASTHLGSRISRARQEAGLTEKELGIRLGLPLWRIERMQTGQEDARSHLSEIAETTGKPTGWFLVGERERQDQPTDEPSSEERGGAPAGRAPAHGGQGSDGPAWPPLTRA